MTLLWRLLGWMRPYRWRIVGALACMALAAGFTVVTVWLIKPLLDEGLFAAAGAEADRLEAYRRVLWLAGAGLAATVAKGLAKYGEGYLVGWVGLKVMFDLRLALFSRLQRLSLGFYHRRKTGELLSRVISDVGAMQSMLTQLFGPAASSAIAIVALSGYMLSVNWRLAALALLVFPVAIWPIREFGKKLRRLSRQVQDLAADLASHLQEILSQMKLVQAYQGEDREVARWRRKLAEQLGIALRVLRVQVRSSPIMETIGAAGFAGLMLYSGYEILILRTMTGGELGSFLAATLQLYPQVKRLSRLWNDIQSGLGAAERVFPVLDEEPEIRDAPGAVPLPAFAGEVRFDEVGFEYRPGQPVLEGVSLAVARGQRVALVGPSGAGKTTLVDLLMRFHDPQRGAVRIDGRDVRGATIESLRRQVALVSQEVLLFNATVRDNLLYARPDAPGEAMEAAARAAGADAFIRALPEGYDTVIGERGVKVSGGERQRLSIARAFLRDAPILALDEATAALDAESESQVQAALEELMANRTVVIIAHRLATVRRADVIVVLDRGRIVERGAHQELYDRGGLYRRLCELQFHEASA